MRFSTVFISSAFVLASMIVALPTEREDMLVARFADSGFLAEVEARAYDEESKLYALAHHRDHDTRETPFPVSPGPNSPTPPTNGHLNGHFRHRRSNVSPNRVEVRAYGEEPELYALAHHRDHDTRETPFPVSPSPNSPTPPTNGHFRHLRSNVSPNRVEVRAYGEEPELYALAHHRDHDTRETPFPVSPGPNSPTTPTNGHFRHRRFNVSPNQVEARAYGEESELYTLAHHRDHDTRGLYGFLDIRPRPNQPPEPTSGLPRPNQPTEPTTEHPPSRLRRSTVSNQVEARAYGKEPEIYARQRVPNGPHRDHDTREWWMIDPNPRPNQPTDPTNGRPRLRSFNASPNRSQ